MKPLIPIKTAHAFAHELLAGPDLPLATVVYGTHVEATGEVHFPSPDANVYRHFPVMSKLHPFEAGAVLELAPDFDAFDALHADEATQPAENNGHS